MLCTSAKKNKNPQEEEYRYLDSLAYYEKEVAETITESVQNTGPVFRVIDNTET